MTPFRVIVTLLNLLTKSPGPMFRTICWAIVYSDYNQVPATLAWGARASESGVAGFWGFRGVRGVGFEDWGFRVWGFGFRLYP